VKLIENALLSAAKRRGGATPGDRFHRDVIFRPFRLIQGKNGIYIVKSGW
jgi:hypothetical protein